MFDDEDLHSLRLEAARSALDYLSRIRADAPEYRTGMDFINALLRETDVPVTSKRPPVAQIPIETVMRIPPPSKTKIQ